MRRALGTGALALGVLGGCGPAAPATHAVSEHRLLGAPAPGFELPSATDGERVSLASQTAEVVVVDFWATWCEPCRASFPAYQGLVDRLGGDLGVVGVSVDEEPDGVAEFARATGARFPLAWDEGQTTAKSYQPPTMPTSYVLDRHRIVRFVHAGYTPGDEAELEREIRSLL